MRRLLQLGTFLLLWAIVLVPIFEFFDRWDPPGLGNDTEMAIFGIALLLCLVLTVCKILCKLPDRFSDALVAMVWPERSSPLYLEQDHAFKLIVPPIHTPLQI